MFNKNTTLLLLGLLFILILLMVLYVARNTVNPAPVKTPVSSTPGVVSSPIPSSQTEFETRLRQQTQADINYSDLQDKVLKEFPWYNNLPLQTDNYFVLFDLSKKVFRAKIYPQKSSPIPVEDQVKAYQQEITDKLKQLGIDTSLYQLEWSINPE